MTGRDMVGALVAVYGPRTTMLAYDEASGGVEDWTLGKGGSWYVAKKGIKIATKAKIFAPGNLRAVNEVPRYNDVVQHYMRESYTLRYTGGMVPDLY